MAFSEHRLNVAIPSTSKTHVQNMPKVDQIFDLTTIFNVQFLMFKLSSKAH